MFVYDYLLTFDGEITLFLVPLRVNGASILFLLNRYIPLTVQILGWLPRPSAFQVCFPWSLLIRAIFMTIAVVLLCDLGQRACIEPTHSAVAQDIAYNVLLALQYLPWACT